MALYINFINNLLVINGYTKNLVIYLEIKK